MTKFACQNCGQPYPETLDYRCPACGGIFGVSGTINYDPTKIEPELPGIWQYRHSFGLPGDTPIISLGEGNTPLVETQIFGQSVFFKTEYMNPTGSFKDRLTAPEVAHLRGRGVTLAADDSSGNAGASFAAYAARAGIGARVFVPDYASGPKRAQIAAYGAELMPIPGPRSATAKAILQAVDQDGLVYASHAYLPFGQPGLATLAYELVDQLGQAPGTVIAPVGHGSLLLGIIQGFDALLAAGQIDKLPLFVGVQARACAPLWTRSIMGTAGLDFLTEGETLAEGVRVRQPVRGDELVRAAANHQITYIAVQETDILPGRDHLASLGFYVEATSAIVWNALQQVADEIAQPAAVVLTGSGLKSFKM